jgi:hypothetical protein
MTAFKICTDTGPLCYCSQTFGSSKITCDASNRITSIVLINGGFSGVLSNLLNFTSLLNLDLSINRIKSISTLKDVLPNSLKSLNLSYNQISNAGYHYDVLKSYFTNLQSLIMDGNRGCGVYPATWLTNSFAVSTNNHQKTYWCNQLDSNSCTKLQLDYQNYVMLPHETKILLNFTTTVDFECKNSLGDTSVLCQSTKSDNSNPKEFAKEGASISSSYITCSRDQFLTDVDQRLKLVWRYNSSLSEVISTEVNLVNLPYANITSIDRHLIFSDNSGKSQLVTLTCDQNMTRYRKNPSDTIKCGIFDDNYFVSANPVSTAGNSVTCLLSLGAPNNGSKRIFLYDSSQSNKVTLSSMTFWLIETKITQPEIYHAYNGKILLTDSVGKLLPGKSGYNYKLYNTNYSIDFPCTFSSLFSNILDCTKSLITNYPGDILAIPLTFSDGSVTISTIQTVFYKKNRVLSVYPQAVLAGVTTDFFVTFNSSTLNSTMTGVNYYCVSQNGNYSAIVMNSTTIKCLSVQNATSNTFIFNVFAVYQNFKMILNDEAFEFYSIKRNPIYPSESVVSLNGTRSFAFSFTESISPSLASSLECQLDDGSRISATRISSNEFKCTINSAVHRNLTFWFIDSKGIRSEFSSNYISIYFFQFGAISYDVSSKQFGNTDVQYKPIVKLDVANIPSIFQDRVLCNYNGNYLPTVIKSKETYECNVSSSVAGYQSIGMNFKKDNAFKVSNIHNTFKSMKNLTFTSLVVLDTNLFLRYTINTLTLIASSELKNDCSDLVVTFNGVQIPRKVTSCNTVSTEIEFPVQQAITGSIRGYVVYYNNPNAIALSLSTVSTAYSLVPGETSPTQEILTLNDKSLSFGYLKMFTTNKIDPVAALTNNTKIKLWGNYQFIDYQNKVRFEVRYDSSKFDANYTTNSTFESNIYSPSGKRMNITLWAVYIPTQESVPASSNYLEFIFMGKKEIIN